MSSGSQGLSRKLSWEHFWIETKDVEGKEPRRKGGNAAQERVSDFNVCKRPMTTQWLQFAILELKLKNHQMLPGAV